MKRIVRINSLDHVSGASEVLYSLGLSRSVDLCLVIKDQTVMDNQLEVDRIIAEDVTFINCMFDDFNLNNRFFQNCSFVNCDLSMSTWPDADDLDSVFQNCSFDSCEI